MVFTEPLLCFFDGFFKFLIGFGFEVALGVMLREFTELTWS